MAEGVVCGFVGGGGGGVEMLELGGEAHADFEGVGHDLKSVGGEEDCDVGDGSGLEREIHLRCREAVRTADARMC